MLRSTVHAYSVQRVNEMQVLRERHDEETKKLVDENRELREANRIKQEAAAVKSKYEWCKRILKYFEPHDECLHNLHVLQHGQYFYMVLFGAPLTHWMQPYLLPVRGSWQQFTAAAATAAGESQLQQATATAAGVS